VEDLDALQECRERQHLAREEPLPPPGLELARRGAADPPTVGVDDVDAEPASEGTQADVGVLVEGHRGAAVREPLDREWPRLRRRPGSHQLPGPHLLQARDAGRLPVGRGRQAQDGECGGDVEAEDASVGRRVRVRTRVQGAACPSNDDGADFWRRDPVRGTYGMGAYAAESCAGSLGVIPPYSPGANGPSVLRTAREPMPAT
jgi:hypothetical protein